MIICKECTITPLNNIDSGYNIINIIGDINQKSYVIKKTNMDINILNYENKNITSYINTNFSNIVSVKPYVSPSSLLITQYGSGGDFYIMENEKISTIYPKTPSNKGYLQSVCYHKNKFYLTFPKCILSTDNIGSNVIKLIHNPMKFFLDTCVLNDVIATICYYDGMYSLCLYINGIEALSQPLQNNFVPSSVCLFAQDNSQTFEVNICGSIKLKSYVIQYIISYI